MFEPDDVVNMKKAVEQVFNSEDCYDEELDEYVDYISTQDSKIYRIFGTPYCHIFGNWPFMRDKDTLFRKFSQIPENVDILMTHDAPYGTSDICLEGWAADGRHKGCPELRDAIITSKPRYNIHGHLHSTNHGEEILNDTKVYNVSIVNESYKLVYEPLILKL